jgi:hypothetical protein
MKNCVSVLLLILLVTAPALAQTPPDYGNTANFLADKCKNWETSGSFNAGFCMGYISGVSQLVDDCEEENVTRGQVIKVTLKYIDEHPEELDKPASTIVSRALLKAFPCNK